MCNICEVVLQRYVLSYRCTCHEKDKDTKTHHRIDSLRPHAALPHADEICGRKLPQILKDGTVEICLKS